MQNNRLNPNGGTQRPTGRPVPQQKPVGRPQPSAVGRAPQVPVQPQTPVQQSQPVQPKTTPTQSYEQEETQAPYSKSPYPEAPRMGGMPPNMGFEDDYEEKGSASKKSSKFKMILFGIVGVVALVGIIFLVMQLVGGNDSKVETGVLGNTNSTVGTTNITSETSDKFDGNPIPVKWPSDVTPTRMEIQLDPTTGAPILMLIGDKSGLGTVIRSYEKSGSLTGYWVIVPDDASATTNNNNQPTQPAQQPTQPTEQSQPIDQVENNEKSEGSEE